MRRSDCSSSSSASSAWAALAPEIGERTRPGRPSAACNGGGCGGWFRSNVTVTWSYDPAGVTRTTGCGSAAVTEDTGGATFTCTVNYGGPVLRQQRHGREGLEPTVGRLDCLP